MANKENRYDPKDELDIDLFELLRVIWKEKVILMLCLAFGVTLAVVLSYNSKDQEVTSTIQLKAHLASPIPTLSVNFFDSVSKDFKSQQGFIDWQKSTMNLKQNELDSSIIQIDKHRTNDRFIEIVTKPTVLSNDAAKLIHQYFEHTIKKNVQLFEFILKDRIDLYVEHHKDLGPKEISELMSIRAFLSMRKHFPLVTVEPLKLNTAENNNYPLAKAITLATLGAIVVFLAATFARNLKTLKGIICLETDQPS